jgi:hypothetical protein
VRTKQDSLCIGDGGVLGGKQSFQNSEERESPLGNTCMSVFFIQI